MRSRALVLALIGFSSSREAKLVAEELRPSADLVKVLGKHVVADVSALKLADVGERFRCVIELLKPRLLCSPIPLPEEGIAIRVPRTSPVEAVEAVLESSRSIEETIEGSGLGDEPVVPIILLVLSEETPIETLLAVERAIHSELVEKRVWPRFTIITACTVSLGPGISLSAYSDIAALCDYIVADAASVRSLSDAVYGADTLSTLVTRSSRISVVVGEGLKPSAAIELLKPLYTARAVTLCTGIGTPGDELLRLVAVAESVLPNLESVVVEERFLSIGPSTLLPKPLRVRIVELRS